MTPIQILQTGRHTILACIIIFITNLCSFKENDIISEWNFNIDTVNAAPAAAVPVATNTNRKTTKRQLLDNTGQLNNQKRSSIQSDTAINAATEQLLKRASMISKEETTSIDESEVSAVTEEVVMDLSTKQPEVAKQFANILLMIFLHL